MFVGAVGQHVGKTSTCLGLRRVLTQRWGRVQYYKPLGQRNGCGLEVDTALMEASGPRFAVHVGPKDTQRPHDASVALERMQRAVGTMEGLR